MVNQTGDKCSKAGAYKCSRHKSSKITMREGELFPVCRGSMFASETGEEHGTTWTLESETLNQSQKE